jgi:hypothetical protein
MKTIKEFCETYKAKRFMNTKQGVDEKSEWIRKELEIKNYIPFREKRQIAEMIVEQYTKEVDGIKKHDSISAYVGLISAAITAHTNLSFSEDPIADYDLLAECGLLPLIISEFQESYNEIDVLLKMALTSELEDNQPGALIGRFLNEILKKLDGAQGMLNGLIGNLDLEEMFNEENVAKIVGLLNK